MGIESVLAQIIRLVRGRAGRQGAVQRLVDKVAAVFVPVVLVIALGTLLGWLWGRCGPEAAMIHAVAVLVIACPCALGLATPAGHHGGHGRGGAARHPDQGRRGAGGRRTGWTPWPSTRPAR